MTKAVLRLYEARSYVTDIGGKTYRFDEVSRWEGLAKLVDRDRRESMIIWLPEATSLGMIFDSMFSGIFTDTEGGDGQDCVIISASQGLVTELKLMAAGEEQ